MNRLVNCIELNCSNNIVGLWVYGLFFDKHTERGSREEEADEREA
jgi:hypothetical protein